MKKIFTTLLLTLILTLALGATALAVNEKPKDSETPNIEELMPKLGTGELKDYGVEEGQTEIMAVNALPKSSVENILTTIIKTILTGAMILTTIALIVTGVYYLISQGNEEQVNKAKDIILYLVIGIAIMAGSLGIVTGIVQFKFLE